MKKIFVSALLLAATPFLIAGSVLAQGRAVKPAAVESTGVDVRPPACACPAPINLTLNANAASVFPGDFLPGQLSTSETALNDPGTDRHYVHTFQWKREHRNCQITDAWLTVQMQANQGGTTPTSSDAGNDNITVMALGAVVLPYNERVYLHPPVNFPFSAGQTATKTWHLNGASVLASINANNRLSFDVEDDTMVKSATLRLTGCCLTN
jgi:hypothetical protein